MNDKIKKMAEECGLSWCIQTPWDQQNLQAFAELIVKDCAGIAYRSCDEGDAAAMNILYEFNIDDARNQK